MYNYTELLKNPFWQKRRLEIFQRDNFTCKHCTDKLSTLHVHHYYYRNELLPWEYPDEALDTLCFVCHAKAEFKKWLYHTGVPLLINNGFLKRDVLELRDMILRRLKNNFHGESALNYIGDIKYFING